MALSKKHYEQFAYRFAQRNTLLDEAKDSGEMTTHEVAFSREAIRGLAQTLCIDFALDNPAFNRDRFLQACGF